MAQKPSIPKGMRDFTPMEVARRNYIFDTIKKVFQIYGYQPIETPAMENLTTLMGKYGVEGDKLLFKVLNSGDYLSKTKQEKLGTMSSSELTPQISEKGLRYDLTVPFARYVVQHQNEISFPFKRFQIQPVWRADRPQKGRYREFYQCDVDVIGSDSLLNEVELVQIIHDVFSRLKINSSISINNRKILLGIAETIGEKENFTTITVAIDKLEKTGLEKVMEELKQSNIAESAMEKLRPILELDSGNAEKLAFLSDFLAGSETGKQGIREAEYILDYVKHLNLNIPVALDLTLARGLDYYTGAIIEVKANDVKMGSICGGGRYDDLTGIFGLQGISGVGVSFGADRIYDVLNELYLFPDAASASSRVFLVNFGKKEEKYCMDVLQKLRLEGIEAELYPEAAKMKKQMKYADNKNIPYVLILGENEMATGQLSVKNMKTGDQELMDIGSFINEIKS